MKCVGVRDCLTDHRLHFKKNNKTKNKHVQNYDPYNRTRKKRIDIKHFKKSFKKLDSNILCIGHR